MNFSRNYPDTTYIRYTRQKLYGVISCQVWTPNFGFDFFEQKRLHISVKFILHFWNFHTIDRALALAQKILKFPIKVSKKVRLNMKNRDSYTRSIDFTFSLFMKIENNCFISRSFQVTTLFEGIWNYFYYLKLSKKCQFSDSTF